MKRSFRLLVFILGFGLLFTSVEMSAQSAMIPQINKMISKYSSTQQIYTPGSAKYDAYGDLVSHLQGVKTGVSSSESYLDYNANALDRTTDVFMKVSPSIIRDFTTAQLTAMQNSLDQMQQEGNTGSMKFKKLQLILAVNAY